MSDDSFFLLSESLLVSDFVDDPEFTEVTFNGEIYTLYRIVRITHEATEHPHGWTHMANVVRVRTPALGVALLRVVDRSIEDARVTLSGIAP